MHHASHNYLANTETKLILCHVTSDMLVTLVTPGKPRKFKIQVQSSKSRVAVWGLKQYMKYAPYRLYENDDGTNQCWDEMATSSWWWDIQVRKKDWSIT